MQNLHLIRSKSTEQGTPGQLSGMGFVDFYSIELPWRDLNLDGQGDPQTSCISPGTYECVWHVSPHHGPCYILKDVPGRTNILIHSANFAGDTKLGWQSELLGCIALGLNAGVMPNRMTPSRAQKAVLQSREAIRQFHAHMNEQPFSLTIEWATGP